MAAHPDATIPYLRRWLRPASPPDGDQIARLIQALDSDQFAVREKASQELEKWGAAAEPALRKAREGKLSAEARSRIDRLLEVPWYRSSPEALARVRATQVLEKIDTPEARSLLQEMASGWPAARETRRAAAVLERIRRVPGN
jgi:hypothetical protein